MRLFPLEIQKAKNKAAKKRLSLLVGFQDEARFGRINDPKRCWAPQGIRPLSPKQIIREYVYAYGACFPKTGEHDSLILPDMSAGTMGIFLKEISKRHPDKYILLIVDGASCHRSEKLKVPKNMELLKLPAYSPDFNPQENIWDELREKFFQNTVFKDMKAVEQRLITALLHLEKYPEKIKSITGWKWILQSL